MPVILNDNNAVARYRIEVDKDNGQVLVTEGTATTVEIIGQPSQTLFLRNSDDLKQHVEGEEKPTTEEVQDAVDDDPMPEYPVRQAVPLTGNPYVNENELEVGQLVLTECDESYTIENDLDESHLILSLTDEDNDKAMIYLSDNERIELAIRLLSTEANTARKADDTGNCLVSGELNPATGDRAIGSAIFTLHSVLEQRKHEAKVAEYEKALKEWAERKHQKKANEQQDAEAVALHELVVRECQAKHPVEFKSLATLGLISEIASRWPFTYSDEKHKVMQKLNDHGTTAVIQLESLKAEDAEDDALDALAFKEVIKDLPWSAILPTSVAKAKEFYSAQFESSRYVAEELVNKLGVTAVKYVEAHGIEYPAK